jgi:uncharacterized protein
MSTQLTCPKCHGEMRTYERNDIHIDQCTECRGVFLDRGELERLIAAEAAYSPASQVPPVPTPPPARPERTYDPGYERGYDRDRDRGDYRGSAPRKRKKSFLEEFFD